MKPLFLIFTTFILLNACSDKDKLPKDILSKQKMREVMWDMIRAGEFLNNFVLNKDSAIDKVAESQKWYDKIYELHKTNEAEFDKSYAYYKAHPLLMREVLDSLSKRQANARPVPYNDNPSKGPALIKRDTIRATDSIRRLSDSLLRKRIIKKNKPLKPV